MACKQSLATTLMQQGHNTFVTGSGGVGKTYVARSTQSENTLVAAPTGIAALLAGGITCHKAFGLSTYVDSPNSASISGRNNDIFRSLFSLGCDVSNVQLDEVSMLRQDKYRTIDYKLRKLRNTDDPFGGIPFNFFGDFFQLEPVLTQKEEPIFENLYDSTFAFESPSWTEADIKTIELTKVYRQSDRRQIGILNSIRRGDQHAPRAIQLLNREAKPYRNTPDTLHLCSYNRDADGINRHWYDQIQAPEKTFFSQRQGEWLESEKPVDDILHLKVGTKVLLCANDPEGRYVNGDRGVVVGLDMAIQVKLINGRVINVDRFTWKKTGFKGSGDNITKTQDEFSQYPIKLAYAISIHKSQGMTLDSVALHLGWKCFSHGQLYVGLSRVRDLRNLSLVRPIRMNDLIIRPEVKEFYRNAL